MIMSYDPKTLNTNFQWFNYRKVKPPIDGLYAVMVYDLRLGKFYPWVDEYFADEGKWKELDDTSYCIRAWTNLPELDHNVYDVD